MQLKIKNALFILIVWLAVYSMLRLIFYFVYFHSSQISTNELSRVLYWGFRFDLTALFIINLPFFFFYFFISTYLTFAVQQIVSAGLLLLNLPFLAINFIDLVYYRFNLRRSNYDFIYVFWDSRTAFISFMTTWWYLLILFLFVSVLLVGFQWKLLSINNIRRPGWKQYSQYFIFLLAGFILTRGTGARPIIPSTALLHFHPVYMPLVTNSTITFLYSAWKEDQSIKPLAFYNSEQLDNLFSIRKMDSDTAVMSKKNVIIIILESVAKEYLDPEHTLKAKTPFLDSIRKESIDCINAYANGLESNQGIVAILGSIPPFTDVPYFHSSYANNEIRGIGTLLKEEGYMTSFFMGAAEDHFGFGKFCRIIGIDQYISEKEYPDKSHHDKEWGISDHYFLPFAARRISLQQTPFLSVLFNLSSHPPYKIPEIVSSQFSITGQNAAQNSISYTDYSLKLFFKEIQNRAWYRNTIFVFTSDHSVAGLMDQQPNVHNAFTIPLFIHVPHSSIQRKIEKPVQHLDIIPTVLDLLDYPKPFMSFGKSIIKDSNSFVINRINNVYQIFDQEYLAGLTDPAGPVTYLYNYRDDPFLKNNLNDASGRAKQLQAHLKAFLQRYSVALAKNQLLVK